MSREIPGTLLLDPKVIEDPYPFYRQLHRYAPVWRVRREFIRPAGGGRRADRGFLVEPASR
jgi:hypothetical protein